LLAGAADLEGPPELHQPVSAPDPGVGAEPLDEEGWAALPRTCVFNGWPTISPGSRPTVVVSRLHVADSPPPIISPERGITATPTVALTMSSLPENDYSCKRGPGLGRMYMMH
jgi:hypothetical protein